MNKENPFDHLFDQINNLLSFIRERGHIQPKEVKIPDNVEKQLESLRLKVMNFAKLSEEIVRLSGISEEELKKRLQGISDEVPPSTKKMIERSNSIKSEMEQMNDKLEATLKHVPLKDRWLAAQVDGAPESKLLNDNDYQKKRRGKFKRFGGDQNWKPL